MLPPSVMVLLFGIAYDLKKSNPTNISSNSEMTMLSKFRTMSFQLAALPRARQTWSSSGTGRTFKKLEEKLGNSIRWLCEIKSQSN